MKKRILVIAICMTCLLVLSGCNKTNTITAKDASKNSVSKGSSSTTEKSLDFKAINLGDEIKLDFAEITVDDCATVDAIYPSDTSSFYSYYEDQDGETYFYLKGTIKNIGSSGYSIENMVTELKFDDKYSYNANVIADQGGSDFYDDYLEPFQSATFYIYSSVPDELINSFKSCKVSFGFDKDFSGSYFDDFDECEFLYYLDANA